MRTDLPSFHVKPELISKIRDYFRVEADKTYSDEAILGAINQWFEDRLDRMSEEIGDVLTSPHLADAQLKAGRVDAARETIARAAAKDARNPSVRSVALRIQHIAQAVPEEVKPQH